MIHLKGDSRSISKKKTVGGDKMKATSIFEKFPDRSISSLPYLKDFVCGRFNLGHKPKLALCLIAFLNEKIKK
jgi:hypothetical protein